MPKPRLLQATFLSSPTNRFLLIGAGAVFLLLGCEPENVRQEKALRHQIVHELRNHSYAAAVPLARQLVERAPQDQRAWRQLVRAQIGLQDLDGARQSLDHWRRTIHQPSARVDEFEGDIARENHDFSAALVALRRAAQAEPKNHRIRLKIALLEQSEQHWTEAEGAWSVALGLKDSAAGRINRAVSRRHLHRWNDALDDLHRAQQLGPDDPEVRRWAKVFAGVTTFLDQIKEFDAKLAALPDDVGLLADRSLLFLRANDCELALDDATKANKLAPWAMRPKLFQAIALIGLNRARECEKLSIRQPLRLEMLSPEFLESISRLDSAIAVERTNPEHFIARSWQLNEIGQPKLALQDAEMAVRLDSKSGGALSEVSYALSKLGRGEEAMAKIKQATELEPGFAAAWQYRGELEMARGNFLAAVDSLSRALAVQETIAVLQKREECYHRLGLHARAEEDHRAVQKLMAGTSR